ncbi:hypothetical protein B0J13DRAFT_229386 [Dactylonectria estremocensis]|uniref:RING-type domain-containing protein n=1 Tax=Dactylonectria estremocensis TaxID=1079267 RepID=A0A9P9J7T4_9HYPO|nr:hypothetical protein B0J13DRAFT_229386 [Dactylonectria estremocensis]
MSLTEIRNVVLLFSNPVWSGQSTVPSTIIRNLTALSSQLAYEERITSNITTLTTTNADTLDGVIQGLLYVPDLDGDAACDEAQYDFIPRNVTRRDNLPPTNYNLVALAPWFSIDCTLAYLASARLDPLRAFVFYKPNNSSNKPQDADSPVWNLEDGGAWVKKNKFPIFAISGREGQEMMEQLSLYSGLIDDIPHGDEINDLYGPNPKDYVRVWTELTLENDSSIPPLWAFFLIVIGALLVIIFGVSLTMHLVQRRRRQSLKRRVESGEVDLEAMGIKRLIVPPAHIRTFPLFTYNADPGTMGPPPTPLSTRASRSGRRQDQRSIRSTASVRSKRGVVGRSGDSTATNFQPSCHICLVKYDHRLTIIRELSCGHIFHPECIDEFLSQNSSLCPMCKHSMLPRGYSPQITNGMVRREHALRRLRERVDFDDLSDQSRDSKFKGWSKKLFSISPSSSPSTMSHLVALHILKPKEEPARESTPKVNVNGTQVTTPDTTTTPATAPFPASDSISEVPAAVMTSPAPVRTSRPRQTRPRMLNLLPTQPEESELRMATTVGRKSPSSFARERMREIAAKNAPFDDPDQQRAIWRRGLSKVFPGYF